VITERERYLMRAAIRHWDDPARLDKWLSQVNVGGVTHERILDYEACKHVEKLTVTPPTEEK